MSIVLFLLGSPGVGKTSLARRFLFQGGVGPTLIYRPKWSFTDTVCAAGHYKGELFDGADTIPYNGAKDVLEWWSHHFLTWPITILDGDRMSTEKTLEFFTKRYPRRVIAVHLRADEVTLAARRLSRGSDQNLSWIKGRETKIGRFLRQIDEHIEVHTSLMTIDDVYREVSYKLQSFFR